MVCLNENISFNIKSLKKNLSLEIQNFMEEYEYLIKDKKITFLKEQIHKKINSLFNLDHFIYINMNENHCTYKHKRGRNEGYFCCKKIRSNNPKKVFLCVKHDKDHVPLRRKKKNNKEQKYSNNNDVNIQFKTFEKEELKKENYDNRKNRNDKLLNFKSLDKETNKENKKEIKKSSLDLKENLFLKNKNFNINFLNNEKNLKVNSLISFDNKIKYNIKNNVYKDSLLKDNYIFQTLYKEFDLFDLDPYENRSHILKVAMEHRSES